MGPAKDMKCHPASSQITSPETVKGGFITDGLFFHRIPITADKRKYIPPFRRQGGMFINC
jgi:hypothetical protein